MPGDPERLGGYWLAARLGAGGRGVVYDAYDDEGHRFAVTVPRGEVGHRYERVTCRHLAEVVAVGSDAGIPYVVSEFVNGPDLRQAVALHGPYAGAELAALAGALAEVLRALHDAGLTHRGLNPESVLLADDGPKVIELGLPVPRPMGACTYQAPEVLTGQAAEAAADVFAWGAVVLFAATGHDPFHGDSLGGIMHRLLTVDPDVSCLPGPLAELVGRALAKDPADRPTAAELLVDGDAELRPPETYVRQRSLGELAEEVYATLTPAQQQEVPGLLLRLLDGDTPHDEGDVLRPLMEAGLLVRRSVRVPAVETSVGKLVAVSDDRVAPASAALYRAWPRLRGWVADEREGLVVHRRIREAARHWSEHRRGRGHLLRGHELDTALGWAATKRRHVRLNQLERDFINDSVALSKQRRKLFVPSLASVAAVLAVAVTMTVVSVHGQNDLRERLIEADARAVAARAESLRTSDPRTAMRLSVAAWRLAPVFEARAALQASLVQPELAVFTDPEADPQARYLLRGDTLIRWDASAVTLWDVAARRRVASYALPAGITALSDDGRYAEGPATGPIDVTTGRAPDAAVYAISRGNRTRVYRGTRVLFDLADAKVALSADGARAAVSRLNGRVELWDLAPRRTRVKVLEVEPLTGADAAAPALAFSPDGRTLAVAGRDGVTLVGGEDARSRGASAETSGTPARPGPDTVADLARGASPAPTGAAAPSPGVLALPAPTPTPAHAPPSAPSQVAAPGTSQTPAAGASQAPASGASQAPAGASQAPAAGASASVGAGARATGPAPVRSAGADGDPTAQPGSRTTGQAQPGARTGTARADAEAGASRASRPGTGGSGTGQPQARATGATPPRAGEADAGRPGSGDPQAARTGDGEAARSSDGQAARSRDGEAARADDGGGEAARAGDGEAARTSDGGGEAARAGDGQGARPGGEPGDGPGAGQGPDRAWGVEVVDGMETAPGASAGPLVFSPDGRLLALPGAGEVRVWNVAERRLSGSYPLKDPGHGLAFSLDGRQLRYLGGLGSVVSLDVSGLPSPSGDGHIAAFSGNGRVAAKEVGNAIELTDTEERRKLGRIAAAGDLAFDAAGRCWRWRATR
ncbi:protein kinase domain-containing protein [[Actinomadura] parvosata]|uniref:protein kinase domain-containing protein n=1 Tax=[Actinomadura] parvosata TaxID=1955412 RepID=UPI00406C56CA